MTIITIYNNTDTNNKHNVICSTQYMNTLVVKYSSNNDPTWKASPCRAEPLVAIIYIYIYMYVYIHSMLYYTNIYIYIYVLSYYVYSFIY